MDELRLLKNGVSAFDSKVDAISTAITRVLDSDDDLAHMYLSKLWDDPTLLKSSYMDHEDAEILFETYQDEISRFHRNLDLLEKKIDNTQELVNIRLDTSRNRLLTFETMVSILSLCFGIMTAVAGYFGLGSSQPP